MNIDFLSKMTEAEIDEYAATLGISTKGAPDAPAKIRLIESRRERKATIRVLGIDFEVPVKRAHDQRMATALAASNSDEAMAEAVELMLGEEQLCALVGACTDADGTVDVEAMSYAFIKIVTSPVLKNF